MSNMNRKVRRRQEAEARAEKKVLAEKQLGEVTAALMSARLINQQLESQLGAAIEQAQRMSVYAAGLLLSMGGEALVADVYWDRMDQFEGMDVSYDEETGLTRFLLVEAVEEPSDEEAEMIERLTEAGKQGVLFDETEEGE